MDRIQLRTALVHLHDWIWNDISHVDFRIQFYGSRQQGTERPDSDFDLAIEFTGISEDGEALALWITYHEQWETVLQLDLGIEVHLELYRGGNFTPAIHAALSESSEVVYSTLPNLE